MDRQARSKMNTQIYEEACAWFVECRAGDLDDTGRREFDRWLRKSPEHLSSYLEIAAIWNEGPSLDPGGKWSADKLIRHALSAGDDNVVPLANAGVATTNVVSAEETSNIVPAQVPMAMSPQKVAVRNARFAGRHRLAIAASIAVLTILAGVLGVLEFSAPIYATALGEQRSIQFEDGSTVELNSRSKIRVKYSKKERDVELIEGQALFHVAHDTARPFIVAVGATRVRAVGTQFDVYKKSNGTVVTVVEGRVSVYATPQGRPADMWGAAPIGSDPAQAPMSSWGSSTSRRHATAATVPSAASSAAPREEETAKQAVLPSGSSYLLAAGEQITLTADAAQKTANPNIAGATAWRERQIVFESATLTEVAEEFNRYNLRQLVIKDPALYGFHISGVFSSTDPESLIEFLQQRPGVKVIETEGEIRVERAK
jgi:transmembrane sensor